MEGYREVSQYEVIVEYRMDRCFDGLLAVVIGYQVCMVGLLLNVKYFSEHLRTAGAWRILRISCGIDDPLGVRSVSERWRAERPCRIDDPPDAYGLSECWRVERPPNFARNR